VEFPKRVEPWRTQTQLGACKRELLASVRAWIATRHAQHPYGPGPSEGLAVLGKDLQDCSRFGRLPQLRDLRCVGFEITIHRGHLTQVEGRQVCVGVFGIGSDQSGERQETWAATRIGDHTKQLRTPFEQLLGRAANRITDYRRAPHRWWDTARSLHLDPRLPGELRPQVRGNGQATYDRGIGSRQPAGSRRTTRRHPHPVSSDQLEPGPGTRRLCPGR